MIFSCGRDLALVSSSHYSLQFPTSIKLSCLVLSSAIWLPVVYLLGAQWSAYEEYNYGWAVPFLCLYLAWKNAETLKTEKLKTETLTSALRPPSSVRISAFSLQLLLFLFALVYWFMRVLQEANPIWRLASWGLAISAVVMTLCVVRLALPSPPWGEGGRRSDEVSPFPLSAFHFSDFVFPVCFFLVAVPWPTPAEQLVIQTLTRLNASLVVEMLNCFGVPALVHGNVIEISAGMVGIDEACSGIRSFQATLMIALFFGEFYRLTWPRRWWLLAAGPLLAMVFNLARTLVLVFVAARSGLPEMQRWHDPTGVVLLLGCFFSLWAMAVGMGSARAPRAVSRAPAKNPDGSDEGVESDSRGGYATLLSTINPHQSTLRWLAFSLVIWAIAVEVSTEVWFRIHEAREKGVLAWAAHWPADNPTLRTNDIPQTARAMLQCDQSSAANWSDDEGISWQAFFLRWLPADSFYGRAKVALSKSHNPAICLTASGMKMEAQLAPVSLRVRSGFELPFDRYIFDDNGRALYVFFSQTEAMKSGEQADLRKSHWDRLRAALAGSRSYGQVNFEVALAGPANAETALQLFSTRLPELVAIAPNGMGVSPYPKPWR